MKWGVRRDEYLKRHTIPRGTKMYRVTIDSNESTKGNKYVTYLPPDRDMYRGSYADGIRKQYGKDKNTPLYENTYTLKEDLKIPSREEYKKVLTKVLEKNDGKQAKRSYCLRETDGYFQGLRHELFYDFRNYGRMERS